MSLKLGNIENLCECSDLTTSLDEIKEVESYLNFSFPLELRKIFENCKGWTPGIKDGKAVEVKYSMPITIQGR